MEQREGSKRQSLPCFTLYQASLLQHKQSPMVRAAGCMIICSTTWLFFAAVLVILWVQKSITLLVYFCFVNSKPCDLLVRQSAHDTMVTNWPKMIKHFLVDDILYFWVRVSIWFAKRNLHKAKLIYQTRGVIYCWDVYLEQTSPKILGKNELKNINARIDLREGDKGAQTVADVTETSSNLLLPCPRTIYAPCPLIQRPI